MKLTILDPALCCSTGVCGPDVDDALLATAANVKWLKEMSVNVERFNIANDADAFQNYAEAVQKLKMDGLNSLPYILKDEKIVISGRYPSREEWLQILKAPVLEEVAPKSNSSCCGPTGCC